MNSSSINNKENLINPNNINQELLQKHNEIDDNFKSTNIKDFVKTNPSLIAFFSIGTVYFAFKFFKRNKPGVNGKSFIKGGFAKTMTSNEALKILNLKETSTTLKKIKDNHRKLMMANHPDKGGSLFLATKINEAKNLIEKNYV